VDWEKLDPCQLFSRLITPAFTEFGESRQSALNLSKIPINRLAIEQKSQRPTQHIQQTTTLAIEPNQKISPEP
jgi:hypothetical protein